VATAVRSYIDCREFPSENNCSLKISGTPDEVLLAATQHAAASHGHKDGPELREMIKSGIREERS
jgi:uncharacterized protein DUF1059